MLETKDEYFDYYRNYHAFWKLYGIDLPDGVLRKVYHQNALRVTSGLPKGRVSPIVSRQGRRRLRSGRERGIGRIQDATDVKSCRVSHDHGANAGCGIDSHHAVKPAAAAFLVEETGASRPADVPAEGHGDRRAPSVCCGS